MDIQTKSSTTTKGDPTPFFSIVTIVKNNRQFVEQTINSVLNQGYRNVEYVVIDGGSTDGTVDIIKSYASRITKWVSETDDGIAEAFNKGLSFCTGDYILFLNSDDMLAGPDVLQMMADRIAENGFPMLMYGDYMILERETGVELCKSSVPFSSRGMKFGMVPPHPCLFTQHSFFDKYGVFDTNFRIAMDFEIILRGALIENVVHIPVVVSNIREGGISTRDRKRAVEEIIMALKKNRYVSSGLSEFKLRSYFRLRAVLKLILDKIGVYEAFSNTRNRLRNNQKSQVVMAKPVDYK